MAPSGSTSTAPLARHRFAIPATVASKLEGPPSDLGIGPPQPEPPKVLLGTQPLSSSSGKNTHWQPGAQSLSVKHSPPQAPSEPKRPPAPGSNPCLSRACEGGAK